MGVIKTYLPAFSIPKYTLIRHNLRFLKKWQYAVAVCRTADCQVLLPTLKSKLCQFAV
jgi:hypothetical protein